MTPTPNLQAAAMRARAVDAAMTMEFQSVRIFGDTAAAILTLPLEADHAELLREAVKVLRDNITDQHKRVMSGEQRFYAKNITNACFEMSGPLGSSVERLIDALTALETP